MYMRDMRLNCNVTRGEIDNTRRGIVVVRLWIFGEDDPHEFLLEGDCLRDLAGCHYEFKNTPLDGFKPLDINISEVNTGVVGDITASARLCMHKPNELGQYEKPLFVNVLRLEFFTSIGRVILECFDCKCNLLDLEWSMNEGEEFAQKASNFSAWQAHIASTSKRDLNNNPQQLSYLYDEIHQRFADSIDFDQYEAALMGWEGILAALADERDANSKSLDFEDLFPLVDMGGLYKEPDSMMDSPDHISEEEWGEALGLHPILETVQDLIEDFEVQAANLTFPRGRYYQRLINTLDEIEEGLTGLLNPIVADDRPADLGMIGCREYLGKMMVAFHQLSRLMEVTETTAGRRELLFLRDGMLELREEISALRFELHNL